MVKPKRMFYQYCLKFGVLHAISTVISCKCSHNDKFNNDEGPEYPKITELL